MASEAIPRSARPAQLHRWNCAVLPGMDAEENMKKQKMLLVALGTAGGLAAVGVGAAMVWNSRQMKLWRLSKKAEKVLYRTGAMLQSIAAAGSRAMS